jgi:hypothetical protein
LSILATWIIGIVLLFSLLTVLMISFPELTTLVPEHHSISTLETIISENPKAIIGGVIPMLSFVVLTALIGSWTSNHKAHKALRQEYETRPKLISDTKKETATSKSNVEIAPSGLPRR